MLDQQAQLIPFLDELFCLYKYGEFLLFVLCQRIFYDDLSSISISSEFHSSASLIVDFVMDKKSQIQNYKTELTNHCEFSLLTLP